MIEGNTHSTHLADNSTNFFDDHACRGIVIRLEKHFDVSHIRARGNPAQINRRRATVADRKGASEQCRKDIEYPVPLVVPCTAESTDASVQTLILDSYLLPV